MIPTMRQQGYTAGQRWIETEGAADCTDAEVRDAAIDMAPDYATRDEFVAGFLDGVASMCVK